MKKLIAAVVVLAGLTGIVMTLMNNKAKSDSKLKASQVIISSVPVTVHTVNHKLISEDLTFTGTITPHNEVTVASETMGQVKSITFDVGSHVHRGGMLVRVDDELKVANLSLAESNLAKARKDVWRADTLLDQNVVPTAQAEGATLGLKAAEAQYKIARRQLRDTRIICPVNGVVTFKHVSVGSTVAPGTPIVTIVDVSRLKVRVNVSEEDAFKLHQGDRVKVTTDVYPGAEFYGYIRTIAVKGDEGHTYPIEIELGNNGTYPLKAGMFAKVAFESGGQKSVLVIPRETIVGSIKSPQVYVVNNNLVHLRNITVGAEIGTDVEVKEGLLEGDVIVLSGQNNLKDGAEIKIAK